MDEQLVGEFGGRLGQLQLAAGECGQLGAGIAGRFACFFLQFLIRATEPGHEPFDGGEVDDVVLDGQFLLQLLGQLVIRVAGFMPVDGATQVRPATFGGDLLGLAGDLPNVERAARDRADGIAGFHFRQETVQFLDQAQTLVVGEGALVVFLDEGAQLVFADALLSTFPQVRGRQTDHPLGPPQPLYQIESGNVGTSHQPRSIGPVPRCFEVVSQRMTVSGSPVCVSVGRVTHKDFGGGGRGVARDVLSRLEISRVRGRFRDTSFCQQRLTKPIRRGFPMGERRHALCPDW